MADIGIADRKCGDTRTRILAAAETAILEKGFAATSVDELAAAVGVSKSGFFYHFRDKNELARALLERFIEQDAAIMDEVFKRGDELNNDPLHGFLVGLTLFAERMADLPSGHPGCLVAVYCYQERLFDQEVRDRNKEAVLNWRARFGARLRLIAEHYPPKMPVDLDDLADMVNVIIEGGIVMSKAIREPQVLSRQVLLFRDYVRLIFQGP